MDLKNRDLKDLEANIIELLRREDQSAISLIYTNYAEVLYGLIHRIVKSDEIAQEVLQDTFLKIWKNAKKYDPNKARLFTWFANIARNSAIDKVRSADYRKRKITGSIDAVTNAQSLGSNEIYIEDVGLKTIINSLDEKYRLLIDMVYFQGYSHRDLEKELNIPLGTIKTRIRSALKELRNKLNTDTSQNLNSIGLFIFTIQNLIENL